MTVCTQAVMEHTLVLGWIGMPVELDAGVVV